MAIERYNRGFRSKVLTSIETQLRKLVVYPESGNDINYKAIPPRVDPNDTSPTPERYNTPLLTLYRDVVEVKELSGEYTITGNREIDTLAQRQVTRIPSVSILPSRGARIRNSTASRNSGVPLDQIVVYWPIIIRITLQQGSGALWSDDKMDYATWEQGGRPIPLTDQCMLFWDDLDCLINAYTMGNIKSDKKTSAIWNPQPTLLDALIVESIPLEGMASPFEIVDFVALITYSQNKGPRGRATTSPNFNNQ